MATSQAGAHSLVRGRSAGAGGPVSLAYRAGNPNRGAHIGAGPWLHVPVGELHEHPPPCHAGAAKEFAGPPAEQERVGVLGGLIDKYYQAA